MQKNGQSHANFICLRLLYCEFVLLLSSLSQYKMSQILQISYRNKNYAITVLSTLHGIACIAYECDYVDPEDDTFEIYNLGYF